MKNLRRIAALWVVGCIAAAGSVFALDLGNGFSLGGEVVAGVKVVSQDDGVDDNTDTKISALYDDWGGHASPAPSERGVVERCVRREGQASGDERHT